MVGALIAWTGVRVNLKTKSPTPEQIREGVTTILKNGNYKQTAQAMKAEFAQHDAVAKASDLLEKLATTKQKVVAHS